MLSHDPPTAPPAPDPAGAQNQLEQTRRELNQARQTIAALERRARIDQLLAQADAVDLDVARLLTETAVAGMDAPDLRLAIEDLRRQKPYLFRPPQDASAMGPRLPAPEGAIDEAASRAAASGSRHDLIQYLRLRRSQRSA